MTTKSRQRTRVLISDENFKALELIALRLNVSIEDALALAIGVLEQGSKDPDVKQLLGLEKTAAPHYFS